MEYKDGKPTSVSIDVLTNGTSKKELAASGGYVMSKEEGALQWHEQIAAVEKALVDNNFDTTKINLIDEDGHTDSLTGVSMKVGSYVKLVQELMDSVAKGETVFFDKYSGTNLKYEGEKYLVLRESDLLAVVK